MEKISVENKIRKCKIQIQENNPFWAYLTLYLKIREAKENELPDNAGAGVNVRGDMIYKKEWVDNLTEKQTQGLLIHELLHLALKHVNRSNKRDLEKWGIAIDIVTNHIVMSNGFELPNEGIKPYNNQIELFGQLIIDVNKKTAEQIYDELKFPPQNQKGGGGKGKTKVTIGFDEHGYGEGLTEQEKKEVEDYWYDKVNEAFVASKLAGKIPNEIERLLGKLKDSEINWRTILMREVQSAIPYDYTYATPHKRSISTGFYMPNTEKEQIYICVSVDVSGSVGIEEYSKFISEIVGIARAFRGRIKMRFLSHDTAVHNDYLIENGAVEKIKNYAMQVQGGGGTSHELIMNHISEKIRSCRLAIFLTDGYSDIEQIDFNKYRYKKLFVITKNGNDNCLKDKPNTKVIKLKEE